MAHDHLNKQRAHGSVPGFPRLLADRLCLDFVNTFEDVFTESPTEFLPDFDALALWGRHVSLLTEGELSSVRTWGRAHPNESATIHTDALRLREAITSVFTAIAREASPSRSGLDVLQQDHVRRISSLRLEQGDDGFRWVWADPDQPMDRVIWEVCDSAIRLLTSEDLARVRQCPGANDCGSLFYDTSRNGTRRWCSMEGCGSRVKMRKLYARKVGRSEDNLSRRS